MTGLRFCAVLALAAAVSACNTTRAVQHRGGQPEPATDESAAVPMPPPAATPPPTESAPRDTSNPEAQNNDKIGRAHV